MQPVGLFGAFRCRRDLKSERDEGHKSQGVWERVCVFHPTGFCELLHCPNKVDLERIAVKTSCDPHCFTLESKITRDVNGDLITT